MTFSEYAYIFIRSMKYEKLICPICQKEFKSLNSHIHFKHKLSIQEFLSKYPNTKLVSESIKQKVSKSCKNSGCGKWMKGYKFSDKRKKQYSEMNSGKDNPFYGKKHSDKTRKLMSDNHADFTGKNNPLVKWLNKDEKNKEEYSQTMKDAWSDPEKYPMLCKRNSESIKKAILNGNHNPYSNCLHGWFESKKFNKKFYYQSSYEFVFLEFCEKSDKVSSLQNVNFSIPYKDDDGKEHNYFPDFVVNGKIVIEIKPKNMLDYNNNLKKIEYAKKFCSVYGYEYKLLMEKELDNLDENL